MIYLESPSRDPRFNLALEEHLFSRPDLREPCVMLWQNDSAVIVGKYQNTAEEINRAYVEARGIRVVRRLSGGGAVYHDAGNLNYTLILDAPDAPDLTFFTAPVLRTLRRYGVEAELTGRNDLTVNGLKLSGCSQYTRNGRFLHHGCIMVRSDLDAVSNALRVTEAKVRSRGFPSVRSGVTTVREQAPRPVDMEEFKRDLLEEILSGREARPLVLTEEDMAAVRRLAEEKYASWEWNYGFRGNYQWRREKRFPGGLVTVLLNVREGRIGSVRFQGDFFGNGDIGDLEAALAGLPLDGSLESALSELNVPYYINAVTARDLCELLTF